jgi:hypothetical protein
MILLNRVVIASELGISLTAAKEFTGPERNFGKQSRSAAAW